MVPKVRLWAWPWNYAKDLAHLLLVYETGLHDLTKGQSHNLI